MKVCVSPGLGLGLAGALVGALGTTLGGAFVVVAGSSKKSDRFRSAEDMNRGVFNLHTLSSDSQQGAAEASADKLITPSSLHQLELRTEQGQGLGEWVEPIF